MGEADRVASGGDVMKVKLVDTMPRKDGDGAVVAAARVSYGEGTRKVRNDEGLIGYLMRNEHMSPFEAVVYMFQVKAPIFVARQMMRHRTASVNEVSARYSVVPEEFYVPKHLRLQSATNRQGSGPLMPYKARKFAEAAMAGAMRDAYEVYREMLRMGMSREQARMVLPVSMYTEFTFTMNLRNLLHFLKLREDEHAQYEVRKVAGMMRELAEPLAPITFAAWRSLSV